MEDEHVAILLEDIRSNFRAFGEALEGTRESLGQRIDELTRETRQNSKFLLEYISRVDQHMREQANRHDEQIARIDETNRRLEQDMFRIDETNRRVDETNRRLAEIMDRHDHRIDSLETRVDHLEKKAG